MEDTDMSVFKKFGIGALLVMAAITAIVTSNFDGLVTAQTNKATVSGTVTDEKGAVVTNAKIIARNLDTNISRETTSDGDGLYRIPELLAGQYEVTAESQGFRPQIHRGIELTVGRESVVNFLLNVGNVEDKVIIEGGASLVETTTSALGHLVNRKQIEQLPLNGRDVLRLATLENGVISTASATETQSNLGPGTTRLTVNGGRLEFNAFLLDGTETADAFGFSPGGLGGGFLGVDALKEFQVLTSSYSAEFGHGGGAVINAITKSGTNQIHGTAFEFLRNSALDARNYFDFNPTRLPFQRNQFGGSLGGPIVKNRAFLFGNYEGLRRREGVPAIFNVLSPEAKQGNLTTGQVTVAPSVQPYLALYPDPNGPITGDTGIYVRNFKEMTNEDFATLRADYKLTGAHSLAGRYTIDNSDLTGVGGVIQNLELNNTNQYVSLEEQAIIGGRGVNTLRGTYNRSNFRSTYPFTVTVDPSLSFLPGHPMGAFSIGGVSPLRDILTDTRSFALNQFEVNDQFIYSLGAHAIKIGGSVRRYQLNGDSATISDGVFFFVNGENMYPSTLAQFLVGAPDFIFAPEAGTDFYRGIRQSLFSLYVQDDWKVTGRLTLNLGLRYEPISTPTDVNGKVSNLRNLTDAAPTVGGPFIDNPSLDNIAPRVGFAWDVFGDSRTSVRGAAGVFYSAILPMQYRFQMSNQGPFAQLSAFGGPFPNAFTSPDFSIPSGVVSPLEFNARQPTVYQWNLNIQWGLTRDMVLSGSYVGSRGTNLQTRYSLNVRTDHQIVNGQKFFPAIDPDLVQDRRFNSNFNNITYQDFSADSYYQALQLNLTKRFSGGLQFQTAYTLSKSIDTASAAESVFLTGAAGSGRQDPFDGRGERGLSDFDSRHNFVANLLYDLPFGRGRRFGGSLKGVAGTLVGGWSAGGIVNLRSGFPFSVALGFDRAGTGTDSAQTQRPNIVPGVDIGDAILGDPMLFVNPALFQLQPAGFYGNAPRNGLIGPNLHTFDIMLSKRTSITERLQSEFRFEAFNLFNRANFAPPEAVNRVIYTGVDAMTSAAISNPFFGRLTRTATSSRQLQLGLKLLW
jgi:Carboxypeptidase regulatory-like domain/TonB dependent receptor